MRRGVVRFSGLVLVALAGCGGIAPPASPKRPPEAPTPSVVRLIDAEPRVTRPEGEPAEAEPLLAFDAVDLTAAGCERDGPAWSCAGASAEGFHGPASAERAFAAVDVEPGALAWAFDVEASAHPCSDVELVELEVPAAEVRLGERLWWSRVVRLHRPMLPRAGRVRRAGRFRLGERTRSVALALTPSAGCALQVHDLSLSRLARLDEPLLQRGYLLRGHEAGGPQDDVDRRAWHTPGGTRIEVDVRVGTSHRLELDLAPAPGPPVELTVHANDRELLRRRVGEGERSFERVSLDFPVGASGKLTLTFAATGEGAAYWGEPRVVRRRAPDEPPPVLLIAVDTLRADRAPCGDAASLTPQLDALEREGVCFSNAVSPSNWTVPAFASLFTGLAPSTHRVWHWDHRLATRFDTLTERLADAGWTTHGIVYKSPLRHLGLQQGFDAYRGGVWTRQITADTTVDRATRWLEAHHDERFFLFLHFNDPHQPFNQPQARLSDDERAWVRAQGLRWPLPRFPTLECPGCGDPAEGYDEPTRERARALYDGEVAYLDAALERLFEAMREHGILDDTLVVFVSDHGEELWDRPGVFGHGNNLYSDAIVRVPFVIRAPGVQPRTVPAPVGTGSLATTLLELLDLEPIGDAPSLASVVRGEGAPDTTPILVEDGWGRDLAMFAGDERLVVEPGGAIEGPLADATIRRLVATRPGRWIMGEPELPEGAERWAPTLARLPCAARAGEWSEAFDPDASGTQRVATGCTPRAQTAPAIDGETLEGLRAMGYVP